MVMNCRGLVSTLDKAVDRRVFVISVTVHGSKVQGWLVFVVLSNT